MDNKSKKNLEKILNKLPSPKILFALVVAVILGATSYIVILFLLSR